MTKFGYYPKITTSTTSSKNVALICDRWHQFQNKSTGLMAGRTQWGVDGLCLQILIRPVSTLGPTQSCRLLWPEGCCPIPPAEPPEPAGGHAYPEYPKGV